MINWPSFLEDKVSALITKSIRGQFLMHFYWHHLNPTKYHIFNLSKLFALTGKSLYTDFTCTRSFVFSWIFNHCWRFLIKSRSRGKFYEVKKPWFARNAPILYIYICFFIKCNENNSIISIYLYICIYIYIYIYLYLYVSLYIYLSIYLSKYIYNICIYVYICIIYICIYI